MSFKYKFSSSNNDESFEILSKTKILNLITESTTKQNINFIIPYINFNINYLLKSVYNINTFDELFFLLQNSHFKLKEQLALINMLIIIYIEENIIIPITIDFIKIIKKIIFKLWIKKIIAKTKLKENEIDLIYSNDKNISNFLIFLIDYFKKNNIEELKNEQNNNILNNLYCNLFIDFINKN